MNNNVYCPICREPLIIEPDDNCWCESSHCELSSVYIPLEAAQQLDEMAESAGNKR